jgi:hypothetical protein
MAQGLTVQKYQVSSDFVLEFHLAPAVALKALL